MKPHEHPEWLQREAEEIERLARREHRRTTAIRIIIALVFAGGAALGLRALLMVG